MSAFLTQIIDFFYPPFRRIMPLQTFRYAACGGSNTCFGLLTYIIAYRYIFVAEVVDFNVVAFKPHIAALFLSSALTFTLGFILNRYIVFTSSDLRGRIQLFRYFLSFSINLVINYALLKLLVEVLHWNVLLSQLLTILIVIGISYVTQRHFTFRVKKGGGAELSELQ